MPWGSDEPINVHLKRITDSAYTRKTLGGTDIEGELIAPIIQESHDADCRREIMRHVRECLSEPHGKRWQRIYGGLALTEKLMQHGSPALVIEVAHGHHFDLVQKVSFLEHFDATARGCSDRRAQNIVREKASALLAVMVPQLQEASAEELPQNAGLNIKDTNSTCSVSGMSTSTGSTAASSSMSTTSSPVSDPVTPSKEKPCIDEAFSELLEWMERANSSDFSGASAGVSPRSSAGESVDGSDWEPIGPCAERRLPSKSEGGDASDAFFTPMPTPAFAAALVPAAKVRVVSL
jgi:hypothetical protein